MSKVNCTFEQFCEFYRAYYDNNRKADKYLDSLPSDFQEYLLNNEYVDRQCAISSKALEVFVGNTELIDLLYDRLYDTGGYFQHKIKIEENKQVALIDISDDDFFVYVKKHFFEG